MEDINKFLQDNLALLGLGTVGLSTFVYTAWDKIKSILGVIWGFMFIEIEIPNEYELINYAQAYLLQNYSSIDRSKKKLYQSYLYWYSEDKTVLTPMMYNIPKMFYKKGRVIFWDSGKVTTFRLFFNIEKFVAEIYQYRKNTIDVQNKPGSNHFTRIVTGSSLDNEKPREPLGSKDKKSKEEESDPMADYSDFSNFSLALKLQFMKLIWADRENISLTGYDDKQYIPDENFFLTEEQAKLMETIELFLDNTKWFKEKNLSYTLGAGLYGPPGTGKTSFIRYIGRKFDIPVVTFDLSTMNNQDFIENYNAYAHRTIPYIIVFEDFDNVFHGRKNITAKNKSMNSTSLSFDCILNTLSGIKDDQRTIVFITTNDITKMDPALWSAEAENKMASRPGRIDYSCYFGPMQEEARRSIITKLLYDTDIVLEDQVKLTEGYTGAQVQQHCKDLAFDYFKRIKLGERK